MKKYLLLVLLLLFTLPFVVFADDLTPLVQCGGPGEDPCQICDFFELFVRVIGFSLLYIIPPVATLLFLYGGITFYTAMGESDKITKGRKIMISVALGLVVIYASHVIVTSVLDALGVSQGDAQWPNINICP